jgi:hypothetical protein
MREQEPKSSKEILYEGILKVLEEYGALCLDVEKERRKIAGEVTEALWNRNWRTTPSEYEDFQI